MEKKTSVVIMPLFIKRLRSFVANPTMKEWGAVSRLVRNTEMRWAFQYGVKGALPVIMCPASTSANGYNGQICSSCPFATGDRNYWSKDCCLVYGVLQCSKLSERLLKGTRLLAIYDEYDKISSYFDAEVEKEILSGERKFLRRSKERKKSVLRLNSLEEAP